MPYMAEEPWFYDWNFGCPECGEKGSVVTINGVPGQPTTEEFECPFCGHTESDTEADPDGRSVSKVFQWSSPTAE